MTAITLRPYQATAVTQIREAFRRVDRVAYTLPTGGGKTVTFAEVCRLASLRGNRVTITAHRREIVRQISRALTSFGIQHGVVLPGRYITTDAVQVGMVQTLAKRLDKLPRPHLLVVDEGHHAVAGSWKKLTDAWAGVKILLVTATPARLDGKPLKDAADEMILGPSMRQLIGDGYLSDYDYYAPPQVADLSGVHTKMGDYSIDELSTEMDKGTITGDAVGHYARYLNGRPAVAFCVTVAHAEHVAAAFRAAGFRAAHIDGSMDERQRVSLMDELGFGRLSVLTSAELISEGVDIPAVAGAILLRPTKSVTVYLQQVGRALRLKPDGSRAIILDHVGNAEYHGLPDEHRPWSLEGKIKPEKTVRSCRTCFRSFRIGAPLDCSESPCGLIREAGATEGREAPEVVPGELQRLTDPWAWAGGIEAATASGAEYRALMARAGTDESRLKMIARVRGYKRGWAQYVVKAERAKAALGAAGMPGF